MRTKTNKYKIEYYDQDPQYVQAHNYIMDDDFTHFVYHDEDSAKTFNIMSVRNNAFYRISLDKSD